MWKRGVAAWHGVRRVEAWHDMDVSTTGALASVGMWNSARRENEHVRHTGLCLSVGRSCDSMGGTRHVSASGALPSAGIPFGCDVSAWGSVKYVNDERGICEGLCLIVRISVVT
jgi:hypothetical protein